MSLKEILSSFNGGGSSQEIINEEFARMAKQLLYGGHFRVLNSKNIYLEEIEFYYHEEDGRIKGQLLCKNEIRHKDKLYAAGKKY